MTPPASTPPGNDTTGRADEITDLVAGYRAWSDTASITVDSRTQAPAATTTFCAFTVSYLASRATVQEGC